MFECVRGVTCVCVCIYMYACDVSMYVFQCEEDNLMPELLRYLFSAYRLQNVRITFVLYVEEISVCVCAREYIISMWILLRALAFLLKESVIYTISKILEQMKNSIKVAKSLYIILVYVYVCWCEFVAV